MAAFVFGRGCCSGRTVFLGHGGFAAEDIAQEARCEAGERVYRYVRVGITAFDGIVEGNEPLALAACQFADEGDFGDDGIEHVGGHEHAFQVQRGVGGVDGAFGGVAHRGAVGAAFGQGDDTCLMFDVGLEFLEIDAAAGKQIGKAG